MTHHEPIDFETWERRLEAGDRSDSLLDLAGRIQELDQKPEGPASGFRDSLRARLLSQFTQTPRLGRPSARRWIAWSLALLAVVVLTFVGLQRLPGSVPAVSAAEVLERAARRLAERLPVGEVMYDRFILDWDQGGDWQRSGVVAEMWRSPDGSRLRYQMYDRGSLLYFEQQDGESLWRSSYVRPVEGTTVNFVYQAPNVPPKDYLGDKQLAAQLLLRDLGNFWVSIDQMTGAGRSDCTDPFCTLSALGQGWECSEGGCTLNLGPVFEEKDFIIQAQAFEQSRPSDGRQVVEVRLHLPGSGDQSYQSLKFDAATFDLLEIEDILGGKLHFRIRPVERKSLGWAGLPEGFFQSVPEGIAVRQWKSDLPLGRKEDDRAWIISADPPPGASLSGQVKVHLEIGYRLTSMEAAAITIGMGWVGHDTPYAIPNIEVPITGGEGRVPVSFTLDTDQLGDGKWAVGPGFEDTLGIAADYGWNSGGAPLGINLEWCMRCPPVEPAP